MWFGLTLSASATAAGVLTKGDDGWHSGHYRAGRDPGVVKIIATSEGFSGTATVTVLGAEPAPDLNGPVVLSCVVFLPCKELVKAGYNKLRERPRTVVRGFHLSASVPLVATICIIAAAILLSIGIRVGSTYPSRFRVSH